MPTNYPGSIDNLPRPTSTTAMNASGYEGDVVIDNLSDAVEAIETELGTDPSGPFATVKDALFARLNIAAIWPISNYYLGSLWTGAHTTTSHVSTTGTSNGLMSLNPFWINEATTLQSVGCFLSTSATDSGSVARFGLYSPDGNPYGWPKSLVTEFGTIDITSATGEKSVATSYVMQPGLWWSAMKTEFPTTAGTNPAFYAHNIVTWYPVGAPSTVVNGSVKYNAGSGANGSMPSTLLRANFAIAGNYAQVRHLLKVA